MSAPENKKELRERNLTITCPYCGDRVSLIPITEPVYLTGYDKAYFVAGCPNTPRRGCDPIFCVYEDLNDQVVRYYPTPGTNENRLHEAIPPQIRDDYAEAIRCFHAQSYKGCVVLCRRVIDAIACDKLGAEARRDDGQTKRLTKLIEMMQQRGLVTNAIKETADEIRFFGDYGAHTQDDGLDTVRREDASDIRQLTYQLLMTIYITPFETQKLRKKREGE